MDSPASHRISVPRATQVPDERLMTVAYRTITFYGQSLQTVLLTTSLFTLICQVLQPQSASTLVWAAPRSLATTSGIISLPRGTEMFQFPRCPSTNLWIQSVDTQALTLGGLPHSEICGLTPADGSSQLIAVYHVLLRPLAPRHPPYALSSLFSGYD